MLSAIKGNSFFNEDTGTVLVATDNLVYEFKAVSRCHNATIVFIHIHQRPEYDEWFGFSTRYERELFRRLLKVPKIGPSTALAIVESFKNVSEMENATVSDIKAVKGIGPATAQAIYDHFHNVKPPRKKVKND